ncbi:hypothetical protein V1264_002202 [Littorina saxatilis]|uniref:Fibrinogen C-terminal domain-containing protein n=1 Tax=Littorina saxatilis TaxID=31220 RepID=A0AAN9GPY7_9CAEN
MLTRQLPSRGKRAMWKLLVLLVVVPTRGAEERGCTSTFQVWQPDQDVLRQIEHVQHAVQNLTYFCQAQTAKAETKMSQHLTEFHNATWRLERDILSMRVTRMDAQLQTTKLTADVSNVRRELDNNNRRVDDLELDLYMLRTKYKDAAPRYERAQLSNDVASLLKNSVGDLKAEWLLMKREIDSLKRESRRLSHQYNRENNSSHQVAEEMRQVSGGLRALEKRTVRTDDLLHRMEGRLNKALADFDQVKDTLVDLKLEREEHHNEMTSLRQSNIRVQKELHELQVDTNRLKERQHPLPAQGGSGGRVLGAQGENSPDVVLQGAAGDDFIPRDCHELYQTGSRTSGVYHVQPSGAPYMTPVYCLMLNGTGHTVIQRRVDGLLNFNRRWLEYQYGFGNPYAEFWVGNDLLHLLTQQKHYLLRVDLLDWEGKRYWAEYSQFVVADSSNHYRLRVGGYTGDAGDSLSYHDNMAFSTEDVDNDLHTRHCAAENQGGWWFNHCFSSNLNGVFHRAWYSQASSNYADGVVWYTAKDSEFYSMKGVTMMLKPKTP